MPAPPLVTVLMAVHDGERFLRPALASVLGQTVQDLELLVVDDGSTDATQAILDELVDPRLRVLRNDERRGLAASLNRGLEAARGVFVARLDADDVALPRRLEEQLRHLSEHPRCAVVGSAVLELGEDDRPGRAHLMASGPVPVQFAALFGSPFFHPTVVVERAALERHELRYDARFEESEDYDLWARVLEHAGGDNLASPQVLYRVHERQASRRRRPLQRAFQLRVARRQILAVAPDVPPETVDLAWRVGANELVETDDPEAAAAAYLEVVDAFEARFGLGARIRAARDLGRLAGRARGAAHARIARHALRLDPGLPARDVALRRRRRGLERAAHVDAEDWLRRLARVRGHDGRPVRVTAVFPEPTPYRAPLLDRIAALEEIDLTVVYAADTVARRTWNVSPRHRAVFLRGIRVPGADRALHHDYPLTPGVVGALRRERPDVVVVSGWSTFAAQAAIAWCGVRNVPYLLVVESHDEGRRSGWRRALKGSVVPPIVRNASGVLVTGSLARTSMIARGALPERVRVFANTVDVESFGERAAGLAERRADLRRDLGAGEDDVVVLCVSRLAPEKRIDVLARAVAATGDTRLLLVIAGEGPERGALVRLVEELGIHARLVGDVEWDHVVELYVAADVFALLSDREPWAVVVNEAAACGLPLVLSDQVGAAHDLLRDGDNGLLVPAGDVSAAARALREMAANPERRRAMGLRSRELARDWGYGPSVEGFLAAVREAVGDRR